MSTEPKKRGRKKKSEIEANKILNPVEQEAPAAPKKRGRKPKGGKILQNIAPIVETEKEEQNVILHLKCSLNDLNYDNTTAMENILETNVMDDNINGYLPNETFSSFLNEPEKEDFLLPPTDKDVVSEKINNLKINLSKNNISDKRSACFWCTYDFHNPPIFIPKRQKSDGYEVYGCFCTPECGVAHLMNENLDSSVKFERYQMMNYIYGKCLDYKKNIKPAPNPYYLLDKYYGTLTIEEYRNTLRDSKFLIFVDKPLTHIFPEMYSDNNDFNLMKTTSNNNSSIGQYKIKKATTGSKKTKSDIVKESFGMNK